VVTIDEDGGQAHAFKADLSEAEAASVSPPRSPKPTSTGGPLVEARLASTLWRSQATDLYGLSRNDIVDILLAMSMGDQLSLADVKNRLSEVVDRLEREHGRVVITKHGHPAAVMLSIDDLESLEETLAILSDPRVLADLREARADGAGEATSLTREEALALIKDR
jgi:antitoxin YefM